MSIVTIETIIALDAEQARALTTQLQDLLSDARDLLIAAYEGRAWHALGYPTWREYCRVELAGFALPPAMAEQTALELRERGWSTRAIAEPLHWSEAKVRRRTGEVVTGEVIGADGRSYRAGLNVPPPAIETAPLPTLPKTDTVVLDLLAAGEGGMTGPELGALHGWGHGVYSATLTRLAQKGRVVRLAQRRGVDCVYVHPEHVAYRLALGQRQRLAITAA